MNESDHISAHRNSSRHRDEIIDSEICGCFYCLQTFPPSDIADWIDEPIDQEQTALCPQCGIDSVIGSSSGFPITKAFLAMNQYWFPKTVYIGGRNFE